MAASKSIADCIRRMIAKKARISPRDRAAMQLFMQKARFSPSYRAAMQAAYTRMAADKSIVNHIQGLKIVKVASPNVEKGKAIMHLNPMQHYYFKKDLMHGLKHSKEAAKISRVENLETAFKYLSNAAVLCGSTELASSLIRAGMMLHKTDKDFTEKELKTSLLGREDEEAYAYLKEVYSSLSTVKSLLQLLDSTRDGQKMAEAGLVKEQEDQGEKEVKGTEDKETPSGNGIGNGKEEPCGSRNGSGNGNGNGNGDYFWSLVEKIKDLF